MGDEYRGRLVRRPAYVAWHWDTGGTPAGWVVCGVGRSRAEAETYPGTQAVRRYGSGPPPPPEPRRGGLAGPAVIPVST
jgi:hypothetical protein